ncbi:site-specific integrase [Plantactinospora sp. S1510]|uniref:Site-specific integrase n=1 Tax=Plantactinospora alkalitolerans TaxID=2789879 RepID=A0ABS0HAP9_9ACTN|nr:site-specific integrase [Plantactinospora alkalitolerans]MBF9135376.1 site-specific integrase [Plantactinospora alkalitolerans]
MTTKPRQRGNSWQIEWRLGGRRDGIYQALSFTGSDPNVSYKLALAAKALVEAAGHRMTRDEAKAKILGEEPQTGDTPTLEEFAKAWLKSREPLDPTQIGEGEVEAGTVQEYARVLRLRILPYLGHYLVRDITEDVLIDFVRKLRTSRVGKTKSKPKGRQISANSVRRAHELLHQVLGSAVPRHLALNPAAKPHGTRKSRLGLPKTKMFEGMFLQDDEVDLIHDNCPEAIADLWLTLVNTGLRLGEALVLRVRDVTVDGNAPEVRVRRALKRDGRIGPPKTDQSARDVTVSSVVAEVLRRRCEGKRPSDLIFPSPRGKVWQRNNLYRRYWLPTLAAAMRCEEHRVPDRRRQWWTLDDVSTCGCPGVLTRRPRMYDARHTEASRCIKDGWLPMEVADRLGHSNYNTTMTIYAHLWKEKGQQHMRLNERDRRRLLRDDEAA